MVATLTLSLLSFICVAHRREIEVRIGRIIAPNVPTISA